MSVDEAGEEDNGDVKSGEDDSDTGMAKTSVPPVRPSRKSAPPAVGASLTEKMGKLKVDGGGQRFSFDTVAPVFEKEYTKNGSDKFELEFFLPALSDDHFKYELSDDGRQVSLLTATPEWFGEEKRMKTQMGKDVHGNFLCRKNDPRVQGHNKTVQAIRGSNKAAKKKFWGKPQVVKLHVKCEGSPNKSVSLHKTDMDIKGNLQYQAVATLVYRVKG